MRFQPGEKAIPARTTGEVVLVDLRGDLAALRGRWAPPMAVEIDPASAIEA